MTRDDLLLRTLLFVPAHRRAMFAKARAHRSDAIVLDLEDAVPPDEKAGARLSAAEGIPSLARRGAVFVRVNGVRTGLTRDDVLAVVQSGLTGVVLPKPESPQDLRDLDVLLREAETANGVRPGDVAVIPIIESTRGLLRAEEIAIASDRIIALSIGAEDYCAELGVERSAEGTAIAHLRYRIAEIATACGLTPIDTPYGNVRDGEGLVAETRFARAIGFKGKYVLHPDQIAPVNALFTPTESDVAEARRVVAAYDDAVSRGIGAVSLDGRMVDAPVAARARRLIARAEQIAQR